MRKFGTIITATAFAMVGASAATAATVIDEFTTTQIVTDAPVGSFPNASQVEATEAIGGWRDMAVTTSPVEPFSTSLRAQNGLLSFSNDQGQTGTGTIVYDGANDFAANGVDILGLNEDLTNGGSTTAFFFNVVDADQIGIVDITVTVYDRAGGVGTYSETIDVGFDPYLRFSEFSGGVDFTNVGALMFEVVSTGTAFDGAVDDISVVPLPASALLLLGGLGGLAGVSASKRRRRKAS